MLAIQCPSCHHDNTPGDRFCAVCGVPLNLKPCPQCGKVDLVTTKVCAGCGATFPPITLTDSKEESGVPAINSGEAAPRIDQRESSRRIAPPPVAAPTARKEVSTRAWPLILVAVAAGGIPLLWMNRDRMPLPKAWQIKSPQTKGGDATQPVQDVAAPVSAKSRDSEQAAGKAGSNQSATTRDKGRASQEGQDERKSPVARQAAPATKGVPQREAAQAQSQSDRAE